MFLGQFVAMALCPKLLTKFSKKNLYNYSSLLGIIPFVFLYIAYVSDPTGLVNWYWIVIFFFVFAVAGASMGVTTVLQSFMIADCVDYEEYKSGIRPDGVFFSGQTFIAKLTSGIATIMSGIFYTIYGFSDAAVEKVNNYISAGLEPRTIAEFALYAGAFRDSVAAARGRLSARGDTYLEVLPGRRRAQTHTRRAEREKSGEARSRSTRRTERDRGDSGRGKRRSRELKIIAPIVRRRANRRAAFPTRLSLYPIFP